MLKKIKYFTIFTIISVTICQAQTAFSFKDFLDEVTKNNLSYLAEKFNVQIAEANMLSQKVFPDPELTISVYDNQNRTLQLGCGLGFDLGYNLELGGKRRSRIRLAKSEAEMAVILLEGSLRELRADAAILFLQSLKQKELLEVKWESYNAMKNLYEYDSIRYLLGEIHEIDMRRTKLEAAALLNEVYGQEVDYKSSMADLNELAGRNLDNLLMPIGSMNQPVKAYLLQELLNMAIDNRIELAVAMKQQNIDANRLRLTKAERVVDLGLNIGYDLNTAAKNEEAPTPAFRSVRAGIIVPLSFSAANRGNLKVAQYAVEQSQAEYAAIELRIQKEVSQAFFYNESLQKQLSLYYLTILDDAQKVYDGMLFKYRSGESNLLEVISARSAYNEVHEKYVETLFEYASSIVELNRKCGIWNVEF